MFVKFGQTFRLTRSLFTLPSYNALLSTVRRGIARRLIQQLGELLKDDPFGI